MPLYQHHLIGVQISHFGEVDESVEQQKLLPLFGLGNFRKFECQSILVQFFNKVFDETNGMNAMEELKCS